MNRNPDPLEKDIEAACCAFAKKLGVLQYKFTSPQRRSVPDRIFFGPNGNVWLIEFKKLGKKSTPAQALEQDKIRKQHVLVFVVDNVEQGKKVIREMVGLLDASTY